MQPREETALAQGRGVCSLEREGEEAARRGVVVATMAVSGGQASDGILQTMTQRDADEDRGNLLMDREPDRMGAADDVTPARTFFVRMVAQRRSGERRSVQDPAAPWRERGLKLVEAVQVAREQRREHPWRPDARG